MKTPTALGKVHSNQEIKMQQRNKKPLTTHNFQSRDLVPTVRYITWYLSKKLLQLLHSIFFHICVDVIFVISEFACIPDPKSGIMRSCIEPAFMILWKKQIDWEKQINCKNSKTNVLVEWRR